MELINPWILYIGIVVLIVLSLFSIRRKSAYREGKKVANTDLIEQTELYKKLKSQYKIFSILALVSLVLAIACGFIFLSRLAKVEQVNTELRNRDIFLCMDISSSVDKLNVEMCAKLKEVVKELDGERFGITIFNASSVLLVPLTNDYEYVLETLDTLEASFEQSITLEENPDYQWSDDFDYELFYYKYEGTLSGEGSSLIGVVLERLGADYDYRSDYPNLDYGNNMRSVIIF